MKTQARQSAFTLLEVLIAVVLIVTVVGMVYGSVMAASQSSERTRQRLDASQRCALALDEIARLLRTGCRHLEPQLPSQYRFSAGGERLLRFVSMTSWTTQGQAEPVLNELILSQGQLQLHQSQLSPDLEDILQGKEPSLLLDQVISLQIQCYDRGQWHATAQQWPQMIRLEVTSGDPQGRSYRQHLTVACPPAMTEVTP